MKFQEKTQIKISKDTLTEPKQVRFSEELEDIDITTIKEIIVRDETFAPGTFAIAFEQVSTPKLLIVKASKDIQLVINGDPAKTFLASKLSKLWMSGITSLSLIVATDPTDVLLVVAGE